MGDGVGMGTAVSKKAHMAWELLLWEKWAKSKGEIAERGRNRTRQPYDREESGNIFTQIYDGMAVYDPEGKKIGTVKRVYLGAVTEAADERGLGPATPSTPETSETSLLEDFAKAVSPTEPLPEELRQRLLRRGFIRIDCTGIFASDRYALSDQIAQVSDDRVTLGVTRDALLKR